MQWPLVLTHFLERARRLHHRRPVASRHAGGVFRYTFGEWATRVDRLAGALTALGVQRGDRVATFGWNSHRHYEAYFAVPCMGAVLHTMNVRLFPEQQAWVMNHAADRVVLVDDSLLPLFEKLRPALKTVEHVVVMGDGGSVPAGYLGY